MKPGRVAMALTIAALPGGTPALSRLAPLPAG